MPKAKVSSRPRKRAAKTASVGAVGRTQPVPVPEVTLPRLLPAGVLRLPDPVPPVTLALPGAVPPIILAPPGPVPPIILAPPGPVPPIVPGLQDAGAISPFSRPSAAAKADRPNRQALDPRLRVWSNGSQAVNARRALLSPCVATLPEVPGAAPSGRAAAATTPTPLTGEAPDRSVANVVIELRRSRPDGTAETDAILRELDMLPPLSGRSRASQANRYLVTTTLRLSELSLVAGWPAVRHIYAATPLHVEPPLAVGAGTDAPPRRMAPVPGGGRVLVAIIDVGGFDFAHPDFLDEAGRTRFHSIWDMGGKPRRGQRPPKGRDNGVELTADAINGALDAARAKHGDVRHAVTLLPQSQQVQTSHATHVASIAAGNTGLCPQATIIGVLVALAPANTDLEERRRSFSDSVELLHAVEHVCAVAAELDLPLSINISLGTNDGAHDGSGMVSRWLDTLMSEPGRALCLAAGNSGDPATLQQRFRLPATAIEPERDVTLVVAGPIHASGRIAATGLEVELAWMIQGDGAGDMSDNEMEIWYGASDRFCVAILPPDATEWIVVGPRQLVENKPLPGGTRLSVYNEIYYAANGANLISVHLTPSYDPAALAPVQAGPWRVRLLGEDVRDGRFNAWIERDDLRGVRLPDGSFALCLPSYFAAPSSTDSHTINPLGCSRGVIAVANLDVAAGRAAASSSKGPARDGRQKPDIAAPGTGIVAANGFAEEHWVALSGTSMASPYVAGVVALMLAANRRLTAAQIAGILQRTARPLPGATFGWQASLGFGVIDPEACLAEAQDFDRRMDVG
jgi:subtilisin family serine protease